MKLKTIMQKRHMSGSKSLILQSVRKYGAQSVFPDWSGTDNEAILMIKKDPRKIFVFGDCDQLSPAGYCQGHRVEGEN